MHILLMPLMHNFLYFPYHIHYKNLGECATLVAHFGGDGGGDKLGTAKFPKKGVKYFYPKKYNFMPLRVKEMFLRKVQNTVSLSIIDQSH